LRHKCKNVWYGGYSIATETEALAAVQKWVKFCTVWCQAETRPCRKAVSFLGEDGRTKHVLERHSWDAVTTENPHRIRTFQLWWGAGKIFPRFETSFNFITNFTFPYSSRPFHLQTDASFARKKWPITQLECLSLLTVIREFCVYLAAAPFMVYTDHISLKYLESHKIKTSAHNRLARWFLALQPYKFTVKHLSGTKLTAADGLSRRPYEAPVRLDVDEKLQEDNFVAQRPRHFWVWPSDKSPLPKHTNSRHILLLDTNKMLSYRRDTALQGAL